MGRVAIAVNYTYSFGLVLVKECSPSITTSESMMEIWNGCLTIVSVAELHPFSWSSWCIFKKTQKVKKISYYLTWRRTKPGKYIKGCQWELMAFKGHWEASFWGWDLSVVAEERTGISQRNVYVRGDKALCQKENVSQLANTLLDTRQPMLPINLCSEYQ